MIFKGCGDSDPQATGSIPEASGTTSRAPAFLAVEEANDVEINARRLILVTNKAHQADADTEKILKVEDDLHRDISLALDNGASLDEICYRIEIAKIKEVGLQAKMATDDFVKCLQPTLSKAPDTTARTSAPPIPVRRSKADMGRHRVRLAAESVKRVVRTHLHIKTGWCSVWRVAYRWMAAASNGYAADDGASNLWLGNSGSLRVTFVVPRRRAGWHQRECKHNGRNNGYDYFHRDPSCNR